MSLKLKDLLEHEKKLKDIIKHAEVELAAISQLIDGFRIRGSYDGSTFSESSVKLEAPLTIAEAVKDQIDKFNNRWFTVRQLLDALVNSGFRTEKQIRKIRPNVSGLLSDLTKEGMLIREDIGLPNKPTYRYKKRDDSNLFG